VRENLGPGLQLDAKSCVRQGRSDGPFYFKCFFVLPHTPLPDQSCRGETHSAQTVYKRNKPESSTANLFLRTEFIDLEATFLLVCGNAWITLVHSMTTTATSVFLYFACQHGAENVIKQRWCEPDGPFRIAYSGKGFLTLKNPMAVPVWSRALPNDPIVRARGFVLGRFDGSDAGKLADEILGKSETLDWQVMHVWERDPYAVGYRGFEPGHSLLALEIASLFREKLELRADPRPVLAHGLASPEPPTNTPPKSASSRVLEVIIDTPNRWWLGAKSAQSRYDRWPGGIPDLPLREDVISRAYYKVAEAFAWTGFQLRPKERVVEIGSSPGGASQWLLEHGARVTGIDPAEMDPSILSHPQFTHWRQRSLQVKRRAFGPFRILLCDANVTPTYTLDTVEAVVNYPTSNFRGLILTMKLPEWELAASIPSHIERVQSWGFEWVEARQLAHNRREYCLAARRRNRKKTDSKALGEESVR
jgi:23S rRNA (cytidine2498-2'-O)-methyltransferase